MQHSGTTQRSNGRVILIAAGLIGWSVLMVLVGTILPGLGISQSQAAATSSIVRLDRDRLAGNHLGEFAPYEPKTGDLVAHGHEYFYSEDGKFGVGVWESKPGHMQYTDLKYYELMYVLDGKIIMTDEQGNSETYGPGEGLILPKGWTGTFTVPAGGVRKIWVSYMGGKKGQSG